MAEAIDILVREHQRIQQILASLETFLDEIGTDPETERKWFLDYVYFLREFVDTCHHGKEEKFLFPKMKSYGFSAEAGPVLAMLSEQGEGRDHLNAMGELCAKAKGPLSPSERELVRGHALGYIIRLRPHMQREEDILFPMILHSLPEFVLDEIRRQYAQFERNELPPGFKEKLQTIAERLVQSHLPNSRGTSRWMGKG